MVAELCTELTLWRGPGKGAGVRAAWEQPDGNASSRSTLLSKYLSLKYLMGIGLNFYFVRK